MGETGMGMSRESRRAWAFCVGVLRGRREADRADEQGRQAEQGGRSRVEAKQMQKHGVSEDSTRLAWSFLVLQLFSATTAPSGSEDYYYYYC
jgi:hypothetical protein